MQIERDYKLAQANRNAQLRRLADETRGNQSPWYLWLRATFHKLAIWIKLRGAADSALNDENPALMPDAVPIIRKEPAKGLVAAKIIGPQIDRKC